MKLAGYIVIFAGLAALASAADARQVYVPGFYRPNGVWVAPHYRTVPDGTEYDGTVYPNGSVYPNVNPYDGQAVPHPYPYGAYPYQAPYYQNYQAPYGAPPASVPPVPYYGAP